MNEKFCILHEAAGAEWSIQNFKLIVHLASACICQQNTNLTVSNTFNIKSEFTAFVRKQKPYAFANKKIKEVQFKKHYSWKKYNKYEEM